MDVQIVVAVIMLAGSIFGGVGFWDYRRAKYSKKKGLESIVLEMRESLSEAQADIKDIKAVQQKHQGAVDSIRDDITHLVETDKETLAYRRKREEAESLKDAAINQQIELLKQADAATMEWMLLENFEKVKATGVYMTTQRPIYHLMYQVYKKLGYDGRMTSIRDAILQYPDENGKVYPPTDEEN